jgi:NAD+ synthase (glutamine-hydrolysing)
MADFNNLYRHGMARVAAFAPQLVLADPDANADNLIRLAREAHEDDAVLAVFPELSVTGYALDDLHHQASLLDAVARACRRVVEASSVLRPMVIFGAALRSGDQLFNCALVAQGGALLGVIPKSYLPNYREFYEKRWFADARGALSPTIDVDGLSAPFGTHLLFDASTCRIRASMWRSARISGRRRRRAFKARLAGATVMVNLSASNATIGKARERAALIDAHSRRTLGAYVFTAAGAGNRPLISPGTASSSSMSLANVWPQASAS